MRYDPLQLAEAFIQAGELDDARDALDAHLAQNPADDAARRLRAGVLARATATDSLRRALEDLDAITVSTPDDVILRVALLERVDEIDAARRALEQARAQFPDAVAIVERLVHLLRRHGEISAARDLVAAPVNADWRWSLLAAELAVEAGDDAAAIAAFTRVIDTLTPAPVDPALAAIVAQAQVARGTAYLRQGQLDRATADFSAAEAVLPTEPAILFNRGLIAADQGDLDSAETLCRRAIKAAPPPLAEHMHTVLDGDPRRAPLAARLVDV